MTNGRTTSRRRPAIRSNYPLIGDKDLKVAKLYEMLPAGAGEASEGRTPADNATVRSVYVIGPDKKIKLVLTYPMTTGRNFDEILRAINSIQLTAKHQVATAGELEAGRGCHHHRRRLQRRRDQAFRRLRDDPAISEEDQAAYSVSCLLPVTIRGEVLAGG